MQLFELTISTNHKAIVRARNMTEAAQFAGENGLCVNAIKSLPCAFFVDLQAGLVDMDNQTMTIEAWQRKTEGE